MKFILLVGLPGSGKSYYGRKSGLPFVDDVSQTGGVVAVWKAATTVPPPETLIISDYGFIYKEVRCKAVKLLQEQFPDCEIEWVVFENNPSQCCNNIKHRNDGRIVSTEAVYLASRHYSYPKGVSILPVFKT